MACTHPLKAWPIGITAKGKTEYKITNFSVNHLEKRNGKWYTVDSEYISPYRDGLITEFVQIPCGKCIGCRLEYSRQWANRLMLEAQYHTDMYFITLTYDDFHIPLSYYVDDSTGEALQSMSLCKRDFQLFMKRLRKSQPENQIRFYAAGEYGSQTFRPHYHAIVFGLKLSDLVFYKFNKLGQPLYTSQYLESIWCNTSSDSKERLGICVVAEVSWETCAYTARYTAKKSGTLDDEFYDKFNMEKPFTLMSRRPGIARMYYDDHPDMFDYTSINIPTSTGGRKVAIPRYFNNLFADDCPLRSQELKDIRKRMAEVSTKMKLSSTDLDYLSYLQVCEDTLDSKIKSLRRSDI